MLRFKTEACMFHIADAMFPNQAAIEEVARIKLHARFGSKHVHHPSADGFVHGSGKAQFVCLFVQNIIVIVPALYIKDIGPDFFCRGEIHCCAADRRQFSRWNELIVDCGKAAGV